MAARKIRCLYCREPYDFVSGTHIQTHFGDHDDSFESFKDWVVEKFDLEGFKQSRTGESRR